MRLSISSWRFAADRRSNILPIFALALIPILALVGAAVDYSRANAVKAALQAALDSTALAMAANAASLSATDLQGQAQNYFNALFSDEPAGPVALTISYSTTNGPRITVSGSTTVKTTFLAIPGFGIKQIKVGGSSTVAWGNTRLRVALVLDNTGSMADAGKLTALKTATNNLLNQLRAAAPNDGDVYVSIIPFAKDVNVGASNFAASWIDWDDWEEVNGSCTSWWYYGRARTKSDCRSHYGTWIPDNHNTWNGCVTDRGMSQAPSGGNYDQNVVPPNPGVPATLYPAEQYENCPLQLMGLSYNWSAMASMVNHMYAVGSTNQPIGLVWGWLSLVGGGPLTAPAQDSNYNYMRVIILLSDGLNTQDRWYGDGYNTSTKVDSRMYGPGSGSGTCANIKAAGITIYTIQVNTDGAPTSTLLQNCASSSDKFFLLTSSSQIITVFTQIGTNLAKLRIAK